MAAVGAVSRPSGSIYLFINRAAGIPRHRFIDLFLVAKRAAARVTRGVIRGGGYRLHHCVVDRGGRKILLEALQVVAKVDRCRSGTLPFATRLCFGFVVRD